MPVLLTLEGDHSREKNIVPNLELTSVATRARVGLDISAQLCSLHYSSFQGSYFDSSNNVDRERNRQMLAMSRGFRVPSWEGQPEAVLLHPKRDNDLKGAAREELFTLENNILDSLVKNLSQDFSRQLRNDTNLLKQSNSRSKIDDNEADVKNSADVGSDASPVNEVEHSLNEKSPLHVLLYGRSNHKIDSYSVLNAQNQVTTLGILAN